MAKPKSRVESAAIAGMLGVSGGGAPPMSSGVGVEAPNGGRVEGAHPVRDRLESGVSRADNALILDPKRVVRRGRYVRPFTDDQRFRDLLSAIEEAGGTIHVPILVRVEGSPGAVEYVLVDGTHRLEAALRLGISIPAINLGRIAADRALAIQAMANEVRASMHVVDQVSYVLALLAQGLTREAVQRTTGFSAGRISELVSTGMLLAGLTEPERARARRIPQITHRTLRALKAASPNADAFREGVMSLVLAGEAAGAGAGDLEAEGYELESTTATKHAADRSSGTVRELEATRYQIPIVQEPLGARRGRTPTEPGAVTFVHGRNARGTSVTFRLAWRARSVRQDPERFLERVRELLEAIAVEATAHYTAAQSSGQERRRRRRGGGVAAATEAWREAISRDEAELRSRVGDYSAGRGRERGVGIPEDQNPMPVPPSQRRPGEGREISARLLAGLSIPMLAERLKRGG